MTTKQQQAERAEAIAKLREWIKPGDTVYTILESVSRSGMSRVIRVVLHVVTPHNSTGLPIGRDAVDFLHPNHAVAMAIGARLAKRPQDGIVMTGAGMDMGFAIVYELSEALYGKAAGGYACLGDGCPSNAHSNSGYHCSCGHDRSQHGNEGWVYTSCSQCRCPKFTVLDAKRAGIVHTDGYALRHRWL